MEVPIGASLTFATSLMTAMLKGIIWLDCQLELTVVVVCWNRICMLVPRSLGLYCIVGVCYLVSSHRCVFAQIAKTHPGERITLGCYWLIVVVTGDGSEGGDMSRGFMWNLFDFLQCSVLILVNVTCWIFEVKSGDRRLILLFWWLVSLLLLLTTVFRRCSAGLLIIEEDYWGCIPEFCAKLQFDEAWRLTHKLSTCTKQFFAHLV